MTAGAASRAQRAQRRRPLPPAVRGLARRLAPFVHHPATTLATGIGMLVTGAAEILSDLLTGFDAALATHHGLVLLGSVMALRGLVDLVTAIERVGEGLEEIDNETDAVADAAPFTPLHPVSSQAAPHAKTENAR